MALINWFNYKDWWSWVYWPTLIYVAVDLIKAIPTLQRWKWGYWSLDFIPGTVVIFILFMSQTIISHGRLAKRVAKLEEKWGEI